MSFYKKIIERLKNKRHQKYLKNKRLKTQLINEVSKILEDIDYDVESDNSDKYFVIKKGSKYQFTMNIENEFVEFYSNEKNQIIGSNIENYVEQVKSTLMELLEGKHWSQ